MTREVQENDPCIPTSPFLSSSCIYTRWAFTDFGIIGNTGSIRSEHEGGESEVKSEHT